MRRAPYVAVPDPNFGSRYAIPPESTYFADIGDHATAAPYELRSLAGAEIHADGDAAIGERILQHRRAEHLRTRDGDMREEQRDDRLP